ncbi:MAG: hypothetical protein HC911_17615 [Chloroflexaceae bacterium]|nr:hypothetical protein [Chloroflexaceae bacterium]
MANTTTRRGRGYPSRRVVTNAADGAALRRVLHKRHNMTAEQAIAAIASGDLATVLIAEDERVYVLAVLEAAAEQEAHPLTAQVLRNIAAQLAAAWG